MQSARPPQPSTRRRPKRRGTSRRLGLRILVLLCLLTPFWAVGAGQIAPVAPLSSAERLQETHQQRLRDIQPESIDEALIEQADLDVASARVALEGVEVELHATNLLIGNQEAALSGLSDQLRTLKGAPADAQSAQSHRERLAAAVQEIADKEATLSGARESARLLRTGLGEAQQRLTLAREWAQALKAKYHSRQELNRQVALDELQTQVRAQSQRWQERDAERRLALEALQGDTPEIEAQRRLLRAQVTEARERGKLVELELLRARGEHRLQALEEGAAGAQLAAEVRPLIEQAELAVAELRTQEDLLRRKADVIQRQLEVAARRQQLGGEAGAAVREEQTLLAQLVSDLQAAQQLFLPLLSGFSEQHARLKSTHEQAVQRGLWARRPLPADGAEWQALRARAAEVPGAIAVTAREAVNAARARVTHASTGERAVAAAALMAWAVLMYLLGRYLAPLASRAPVSRAYWLGHAFAGALARHLGFLLVGGMAAITALLIQLPQPALTILLASLAMLLLAMLIVGGTRALLGAARHSEYWALYRDLRRLTWTAAVAGLAMLLLAQLPVSPLLSELAGRGFMLLMFIVVVPLLRVRRMLLERIARTDQPAEGNRARATAVGTLLVPVMVLLSAALGLAGYVNLAWAVLGYLIAALLVSGAWFGLRAGLHRAVDQLKDWTIRHAGYGLLWTQGVIEPLHRVLRTGLALGAWVALFYIYGWDGDSRVVQAGLAMLDAPLLSFGSNRITLKLLLVSALVLVSMFWIARWSRELTYRWLFAGVSDSGARNSLAVFTQYTVVLIGVLVAINLLGLDLTTITVFAGALGVGLGFGLQNIANNFISGLILLAERPVRAGDTVSIGTNSGSVSRIGIRSLTVRTWDNQEVIIPNADIISQPFTNWTHSDNVVRTVFVVGIGFEDDPAQAQAVIRAVLEANPAVLREPEPTVLLDGFGASALQLRVLYHTDMSVSAGPAVKSEVLIEVLRALRGAGLSLPFPQQDVHVRHVPARDARPEDSASEDSGFDAPRPVPAPQALADIGRRSASVDLLLEARSKVQ